MGTHIKQVKKNNNYDKYHDEKQYGSMGEKNKRR